MKYFKLNMLLFVCLFSASAVGQLISTESISIGQKVSFNSNILDQSIHLFISLPDNHADSTLSERYPVLYVLDGDLYFRMTSGLLTFSNSAFKLPEMILVGISSNNRIKDLTPNPSNLNMFGDNIPGLEQSGGGSSYIHFIEKEVIPFIEENYRANQHRILAGHSFGGLLCSEIYLNHSDLFDRYIMIDPSIWWNQSNQINQLVARVDNKKDQFKPLYIAKSGYHPSIEENLPHLESIDKYISIVEKSQLVSNNFKADYFPLETHSSIGVLGIFHGLAFMYRDYRPAADVFKQSDKLVEHYNYLSEIYDYKLIPPESLIRNLAWGAQYGEKDINKAIGFFKLNVTMYPKSYFSHKVLGEAYESKGDLGLALDSYKKALLLKPSDPSLLEYINRIDP